MIKPDTGTMYSSWQIVEGNRLVHPNKIEEVFVWGYRDPEHLRKFEGEPVTEIYIYNH